MQAIIRMQWERDWQKSGSLPCKKLSLLPSLRILISKFYFLRTLIVNSKTSFNFKGLQKYNEALN